MIVSPSIYWLSQSLFLLLLLRNSEEKWPEKNQNILFYFYVNLKLTPFFLKDWINNSFLMKISFYSVARLDSPLNASNTHFIRKKLSFTKIVEMFEPFFSYEYKIQRVIIHDYYLQQKEHWSSKISKEPFIIKHLKNLK